MSEQIDQFFAPDGRLISIPVKSAKKIAVLKEIAMKLSPDTQYPGPLALHPVNTSTKGFQNLILNHGPCNGCRIRVVGGYYSI